ACFAATFYLRGATMLRRQLSCLFAIFAITLARPAVADELPIVVGVEAQPLKAQVQRVVQALQVLGEPLTKDEQAALDKALAITKDQESVEAIQKVLDKRCLAGVDINPESRVKVARGAAPAQLIEQGWRTFLVKVHNEAGVTAPLRVASPNAAPLFKSPSSSPSPRPSVRPEDVPSRWMEIQV